MAASKLAMTAYLSKGRSIVMFPEGTWNLTENRLMLPMPEDTFAHLDNLILCKENAFLLRNS